MRKTTFPVLLILCLLIVSPTRAGNARLSAPNADTTELPTETIRIFFDCRGNCYEDFLKTKLQIVNFVRDRKLANVHLLITTQPAGSGGNEYTLRFVGLERFSGISDTLRFVTMRSETDDVIRRRLLNTLKLGLARYIARTPQPSQAEVSYQPNGAFKGLGADQTADPWNNWVFNVDFNIELSGQRSNRFIRWSSALSANRITETVKMRFGLDGSYSESKFIIDDGTVFSFTRSYGLRGLVVDGWDEHWSVGMYGSLSSSTYDNTRLWVSVAPAVEYDIFPYSESTRRQLRFLYRIGFNRLLYLTETIYDQDSESLFAHSLSVSADIVEEWGRASGSIEASQYLQKLEQNRMVFYAEGSFRLFEGLSLNLSGLLSLIHDQRSLPKLGASPEEILLQRRELATSYSYYTSIGFSYSFGSIYSTAVNPRFGK